MILRYRCILYTYDMSGGEDISDMVKIYNYIFTRGVITSNYTEYYF